MDQESIYIIKRFSFFIHYRSYLIHWGNLQTSSEAVKKRQLIISARPYEAVKNDSKLFSSSFDKLNAKNTKTQTYFYAYLFLAINILCRCSPQLNMYIHCNPTFRPKGLHAGLLQLHRFRDASKSLWKWNVI